MKSNSSWRIRLAQVVLGVAIVVALTMVHRTSAGDEPVHLVTDWSHHHLIFSAPHDFMDALRLSRDPRYIQQWIRRNVERKDDDSWRWRRAPEGDDTLQSDWSMNMSNTFVGMAGTYPAKFSFNAGVANCVTPAPSAGQQPDFIAYNTSGIASTAQASIIAYANLYATTCSGTVPNTYWAYNTLGQIFGSIALSADGTQVAFVQVLNYDGNASLTLLKWAAGGGGTASAPTTPTSVTNVNYRTCTAPCMTNIELNVAGVDACATSVSFSSPFYDFSGSDTMYLGDDDGILHQYTGVFNGTPAEELNNGWPSQVSPDGELTSPVYVAGGTPATSYTYVGDTSGFFYRVSQTNATTVTAVQSGSLGTGIVDGPVVDSVTGNEYVFVGGNTATGPNKRIQVVQFGSTFASGSTGAAFSVSSTSTRFAGSFYAGTFDNTYYTSVTGTGNMYACGTNAGKTALWRIPVTAGVIGTPVASLTLSTSNPGCSPITENYTGTIDRIFVSVTNAAITGAPINCPTTGGCLMSFNVTTGSPTATSAHATEANGTTGIIVDGSSGSTGASQVYFIPLNTQTCTTSGTSGSCAIQASQSGLM